MPFKIVTSKYSSQDLRDTFKLMIEDELNASYPINDEVDIELITFSKMNEDFLTASGWTLHIKHTDELYKEQIITLKDIKTDKIHAASLAIAKMYIDQKKCTHETLTRKTYNGREFPDGSGVCKNCGVETGIIFAKLDNGTRLLDSTFSKHYVTCFDWKEISAQFGASGVVLGKNPYRTAFFEAFPEVSGYRTFIRGEGGTVEEAEKACWDTYQKQLNCKGHEFSREVRGKHRTDGYGKCKSCGLCSSEALPPETVCVVCSKPTKEKFKEEFYCVKHFFDISLDEHINNIMTKEDCSKFFIEEDEFNPAKEKMNNYVEYSIYKSFFEKYGEAEFLKKKDVVCSMCYHFENLYDNKILGIKPFTDDANTFFPLCDDAILNECLDFFKSNLDTIMNLANNKKSIPGKLFFPVKYLENK